MKALQLVAASQLAVVDLPVPSPGPGEVRLRVKACGICGSDLHGMDGSSGRRIPPVVMGHEASGVIDAVGEGVEDWSEGDRVTFDSTVWCGECSYCREGRVNLCDSRQVVGVACAEFRRDGAFAEFVTVPRRILHRLPEGLSFEEAAFAEPVGVALHAVRRAGDVSGAKVLVVGAGLIGLLVIQALKRAGAAEVIAVDLDQGRLDLARELGADQGILSGAPVPEVDLAMEVVGATPTVDLAVRSVRKGGRVVLVGNLAPSVALPLQLVVTRELDVLGSCAIAGEYPDALAAIAAGEIRVKPLVSAAVALERGVEAFVQAAAPGALKVLITGN
ncbi:galactitol-1-phosphate 5-dehydrogenase [Luteolibacter marinus]|uniref:galactitol-1-phosphate 5-dehydrogenase n=1 Tax=Luteolibacter marinus TaxID=2776705 RepID=UPI0018686B1E|nr:galactitol-1-phosphate 5-dehydrogenase [Luteolibacter marinus]